MFCLVLHRFSSFFISFSFDPPRPLPGGPLARWRDLLRPTELAAGPELPAQGSGDARLAHGALPALFADPDRGSACVPEGRGLVAWRTCEVHSFR